MYIKDVQLNQNPQKVYKLEIGTLTVFENFLVTELNEGLSIGYANGGDILDVVLRHFGNSGDFGLICNRINTYSIIPTELGKLASHFKNTPKVAIVNYTELGKISAAFERNYWPFPVQLFDNLESSVHWVNHSLQTMS